MHAYITAGITLHITQPGHIDIKCARYFLPLVSQPCRLLRVARALTCASVRIASTS